MDSQPKDTSYNFGKASTMNTDKYQGPEVRKKQSQNLISQSLSLFIQQNFSVHFNEQDIISIENPQVYDSFPDLPPPELASYLSEQSVNQEAFKSSNHLEDLEKEMKRSQILSIDLSVHFQATSYIEDQKNVPKDKRNLQIQSDRNGWKSFMPESVSESGFVNSENFVQLETLGRGAFGKVHRVIDKSTRKFYAVKEIHRSDFSSSQKFDNASILELINLANVSQRASSELLKIYQVKVNKELGQLVAIFEMGQATLDQLAKFIDKEGIGWDEDDLEKILRDLVEQVELLRERGIYHRDIKPANVIWAFDSKKMKFADYGCSLIAKSSGKNDLAFKKAGVAGTPFFMAPELLDQYQKKLKYYYKKAVEDEEKSEIKENSKQFFDQDSMVACDLFSIGMTILLITAPKLKRDKMYDYLNSRFEEDYPRLAPIIAQLLDKDPQIRLKAIPGILDKQYEKPFNLEQDDQSKFRKFQFQMIIDLEDNQKINHNIFLEMAMANDAIELLEAKIAKCTSDQKYIELNIALIICLINKYSCPQARELCFQLFKSSQFKAITDEKQKKLYEARIRYQLGIIFYRLGMPFDSLSHLLKSIDLFRKLKTNTYELNLSLQFVSTAYRLVGKPLESNLVLAECLIIESKSSDCENFFVRETSYAFISVVFQPQDVLEALLKKFNEGLETKKQKFGENHWIIGRTFNLIGAILFKLGRQEESKKAFDKAIEVVKTYFGKDSPEQATYYFEQGYFFTVLGKSKRGYDLLQKACEIEEKFPEIYKERIATFYAIQSNYLTRGLLKKSLDLLIMLKETMDAYFGSSGALMGLYPYIQIMYVYYYQSRFEESFEMSNIILKTIANTNHPFSKIVDAHFVRGLVLLAQDKLKEAKQEFDKLAETANQHHDQIFPLEILPVIGYALYGLKIGEIDDSIQLLEKAHKTRNQWLIDGFSVVEFNVAHGFIELQIAEAYEAKGCVKEAIDWYNKCVEFSDEHEQADHLFKGRALLKIAELKGSYEGLDKVREILAQSLLDSDTLLKKCDEMIEKGKE